MSSEEAVGNEGSAGGTPIDFSGVSAQDGLDVSSQPQAEAGTRSTAGYKCDECGNTLKTPGGFRRHKLLHKLKDAVNRKPLKDEMQTILYPTMVEVLEELARESSNHARGTAKKNLVNIFLAEIESKHFSFFLCEASECFMEILLSRSKVMPRDQVEENMTRLQSFLANDEIFNELIHYLTHLVPKDSEFDPQLLNAVVYRLLLKYFDRLQIYVLKCMRLMNSEADGCVSMSESESNAFEKWCGHMLRAFANRGKDSKSSVWSSRINALCSRFVCKPSGEKVTKEDFVNSSKWDLDEGGISLTPQSFNLFYGLECIVRARIKEEKLTADNVWDSLADGSNSHILNNISWLTQGLLTEENTLNFLFDLVKSFTHLSCRAEAEHFVQQQELSVVPVRTNLKRNA